MTAILKTTTTVKIKIFLKIPFADIERQPKIRSSWSNRSQEKTRLVNKTKQARGK